MDEKVSVSIPATLYQQTQRFARTRQQDTDEAISMLLERALAVEDTTEEVVDWTEPDPAVEREMQAYIAMHPKLKDAFFGKYVAIYHGELIDHDSNMEALFERIDKKYPDEFVWLSRVESEPIETIRVRSPRIVSE